jgi:hypothetical protein
MHVQVGSGPPPLYGEDIVAAETVYKPNTETGRLFRHPIPQDQWQRLNAEGLSNMSFDDRAVALDEDSLFRNGGVTRLDNGAFDTIRVAFYVTYNPYGRTRASNFALRPHDVDYTTMHGVYPIDGDRNHHWSTNKRTILVACRGTDIFNAQDVYLDGQAFTQMTLTNKSSAVRNSNIYKTSIRSPVLNAQKRYPPGDNDYFATGHSLGGAFADELVREGLVLGTVNFNPLISVHDVHETTDSSKVSRLYVDTDFVLNALRANVGSHKLHPFYNTISVYDPLPNYKSGIQSHEMTTFRAGMRNSSHDNVVKTLLRPPASTVFNIVH